MPFFRRRKRQQQDDNNDTTTNNDTMGPPPKQQQQQQDDDGHTITSMDSELRNQTQEVMSDNLELMREILEKIKNDPNFAKNIYKNCPRLQHLLDQYPDLRPVFEDPKLVRINFEQVYKDAGGVLDGEPKKRWACVVWFVNSPFFKIIKCLLFFKKIFACVAGGGVACISACVIGCCFEDALDELEETDDANADDAPYDANREALNRAADHMEDPEVQEHLNNLLEDPEGLEDAIENDQELKALRDSNMLCEELMSDPETMRVLTDPDNLRALGEAPTLIEADFVDPDSFVPPDLEMGESNDIFQTGNAGMEYDGFDGGVAAPDIATDIDIDIDADIDADFDCDPDDADYDDQEETGDYDYDYDEEEEEEDGDWWEDAEVEQQDADAPDTDTNNNPQGASKSKNTQQAKSQQTKRGASDQPDNPNQSRFGGIMASIGVAAADLVAEQIVGQIFGDSLLPAGLGAAGGGAMATMGGGGDDMDMGRFDDVADTADNTGEMVNDDVADVAADTVDEADDKKGEADDDDDKSKSNNSKGGADVDSDNNKNTAAADAKTRSNDSKTKQDDDDDDTNSQEEEPKKKGRFGFIKTFGASVITAAKEHVATTLLGDDFGEDLVERQEEGGDSDDDDDKKKKKDDDDKEEPKKKRGLFRRKK